MLIEDVMTRDPVCCNENETASTAVQAFWERDCGCVPLVNDDGQLCGIITDRDLLLAAHFRGCTLQEIRLRDAKSQNPVYCGPNQSVRDVGRMMQTAQVRRIPVVSADRRVVGIVSLNDLAVARQRQAPIPAQEVADTLGRICARAA